MPLPTAVATPTWPACAAPSSNSTGVRRGGAAALESRDDLLRYLQSAEHLLEIGPFDNPSLEPLRRPGLQIDYADYLSRAELGERAKLRPERHPEAVPPIRYVLSEGGYDQIQQRYDAVVSHHCLEHQPDLIGHLLQVAGLLKPGGTYLFTVPDQRRCFDRHLPPTTLIDPATTEIYSLSYSSSASELF